MRGYRIEEGEIEAVLRQYPGVQDALVQVREEGTGEKRLVGYLVADPATQQELVREETGCLYRHLAGALRPDLSAAGDSRSAGCGYGWGV